VDLATIERIKLFATLLHNVALTFVGTGVIAPIAGLQVPGNAFGAISLL
jgi:hypothetical protein